MSTEKTREKKGSAGSKAQKGAKGKRASPNAIGKKVTSSKIKGAVGTKPHKKMALKKAVSIRKQRLPSRRSIIRNPGSAWIQFTNEYRKELKERYPQKKFGDLSTMCSNKWRSMSAEERAPYVAKFNELRRDVETQKANLPQKSLDILREHARRRRIKRRQGPKAALSAYMCFVKEERDAIARSHPEADNFQSMGKLLGQMWRELDESKRTRYQELAERDVERYRREREEFDKEQQQAQKSAVNQN